MISLFLGSLQVYSQQITRTQYLQMLGEKSVQIRYRTNQTINKELISELNPGLHILIYQQNGQEKSMKIRTNSF